MFNLRKIALLFIDLVVLAASYVATFAISTLSSTFTEESATLLYYFFNFVVFALCIFGVRSALRIYSSIWRYPSVSTYMVMLAADFVGATCALIITRVFFLDTIYINVWHSFVNISLFALITLISRFCYQYLMNHENSLLKSDSNKINVAIVGAGKTGSLLVDELLHNSNSQYRPVRFIDVDKYKIGGYVSGIKVISEAEGIKKEIARLKIKEVIIALPSLTSDEASKMYEIYSATGCKVKLYDFAIGKNSGQLYGKRHLRDFNIEDLLFRDALSITGSETVNYYKGKTVLVTGGGGSIGSEICRQIAKTEPEKLIIFDIYENNAYDIQQELVQIYGDKLKLRVEIGSVRDRDRLDKLFDKHRPDVVFHAAAHKHVPLMEKSCSEAIKNNVFGTYNTADFAEKYGVKKFVMISTDKAVNPTNIMGATKRLCEMIVQSRFDSKVTEFAAVRFGNVLGSNGSVIPLFRRQIAAGGPVTITDKRIIRYFMTIPEASQLVLQAGAIATSGELFVLDMGKPVKIIDLATNMIKLAGYIPYKEIDIVETGLRPGEKLYEELLMASEDLDKTDNDLIFIEKDKPLSRGEIEAKLDVLRAVVNGKNEEIRRAVKAVVPTYKSPDVVNDEAENSDEMKMVAEMAID